MGLTSPPPAGRRRKEVPVMNQISFSIQYREDDGWDMERFHFHDYVEILLPVSGWGEIYVNSQVHPLSAGQIYLLGGSVLHRTLVEGHYGRYVLYIRRGTLEQFSTLQTDLTRLAIAGYRSCRLGARQEEITRLFRDLSDMPQDSSYGGDLTRMGTLLTLLGQVAPSLLRASGGMGEKPGSAQIEDKIKPAIRYIRENLTEKITLEDVAAEVHVSRHYMCRIFKQATGYKLMDFVNQSRVCRAQELLREGVSVREAGERVGFSDYCNFIRTFRKIAGVSPGRYGRSFRAGDIVLFPELTEEEGAGGDETGDVVDNI